MYTQLIPLSEIHYANNTNGSNSTCAIRILYYSSIYVRCWLLRKRSRNYMHKRFNYGYRTLSTALLKELT